MIKKKIFVSYFKLKKTQGHTYGDINGAFKNCCEPYLEETINYRYYLCLFNCRNLVNILK